MKFRETTNPSHDDETAIYLSNLAFNSQEEIILDDIIAVFELTNTEARREYLSRIKEYYLNKGTLSDFHEFDEHVDKFLNKNIGNIKGAFLELLIYKLIRNYCSYNELYKECKVTYKDIKKSHPYDIIILNDIVKFIEIKFSCYHLKPNNLIDLVEYLDKENIEAYLISLDSLSKILDQIDLLKFQNKISNEQCEYFKNKIYFITKPEIYESVLYNKCLTNLVINY